MEIHPKKSPYAQLRTIPLGNISIHEGFWSRRQTINRSTSLRHAFQKLEDSGHNSVLIQDDIYWMVYHAYDARLNGIPNLRIEAIEWSEDGWPTLPSQH